MRLCGIAVAVRFATSAAKSTTWSPEASATLPASVLEAIVPAGAALTTLKGEDLVKELNFMNAFIWPAVNFAQLSSNHTIHHRGQLTMYLRAINVPVPALYGPSADENPFNPGS